MFYLFLQQLLLLFRVGAPGIEPGPYVPKTYILPIYYAPKLLPYTSIYIGEVKNPASARVFMYKHK